MPKKNNKKIRVAINGFGRIGRQAFKIALEKKHIDIVAINDLTDPKVHAHLLKYDSVYGVYDKRISVMEAGKSVVTEGKTLPKKHFTINRGKPDYLVVNKKKVLWLSERDPAQLPWKKLAIDVVLECTGFFTKDGAARAHIRAGAKRVVVSAATKGSGDVAMFLRGVNDTNYAHEDVIGNGSCTTNCVTPIAAIIHSSFGVVKAAMTTIHSVTTEQGLVDGPPPGLHQDLRRGRSALINIVPTTTGAATASAEVIPELQGIFDGMAIRVPTIVGSLSDFTFLVKRNVTVPEVNAAFKKAIKSPIYKGIVDVSYEPIVSSDVIKNTHSAIVDLSLTKVIDGNLVKVISWYDNEWGYAHRLVEMIDVVARDIKS